MNVKMKRSILLLIGTTLSLLGCTTGDSSTVNEDVNPAADAEVSPIPVERTLSLSIETQLSVGERVSANIRLAENDETQRFDTDELLFEIADETVLARSAEEGLVFQALAVGETTISVRLGDLSSNEVSVIVQEAAVTIDALTIQAMVLEAEVGQSFQLIAVGTTSRGEEVELSDSVTWASSNPAAATVTDTGLVEIVARGSARISANLDDLEATVRVRNTCNFPAYDDRIELNATFPPLAWTDAYNAEGDIIEFSMRSLFCDAPSGPTTVAVIVGAGWCSACTTLTVNIVNPIAELLKEAGMEILYIEAENGAFEPADGVFAFRHIERLIGTSPGIRAGDLNTFLDFGSEGNRRANEYIRTLSMGSYPSAWVIRTADMKVIADQNTSEYWLPFLPIAQDPDADWSSPPPPPPPPFQSNCEEGDEEDGEPNDTSFRATRLDLGETSGGICTAAPDFYRISQSGRWRLSLNFIHAEGDLDLYLWDKDLNELKTDADGIPLGSWTENDMEVIESEGNAIVMIMSYQRASNTYTLNLETLE